MSDANTDSQNINGPQKMGKGRLIVYGIILCGAGILSYRGCEQRKAMMESQIIEGVDHFVNQTDNYMNINRLVKEGKYSEVDSIIKKELKDNKSLASITKEQLYNLNLSDSCFTYSVSALNKQIDKIDSCLAE